MTIEDKRNELKEICRNVSDCCDCPVWDAARTVGGCYLAIEDEDYISRLYSAFHNNDSANTTDNVNHPAHYQGAHECIDIMEAMFGRAAVKAFCKCNAFKYRFRADKKNGAEDIKKAEWYEDYLIKMEQEDKN